MNNNLTNILGILEDKYEITDTIFNNETKGITIFIKSKFYTPKCECGCNRCNIHSYHNRIINHSRFTDAPCNIIYRQVRYLCKECGSTFLEPNFISIGRSNQSDTTISYILKELKTKSSFSDIASRANVSSQTVINIFERYINCKRKHLPKILCIDEFKNLSFGKGKYACLLLDYQTGEIIDVLASRRLDYLRSYFNNISKEEKDNVEFLVSDMYDGYKHLHDYTFHNSTLVIDAFHYIRYITNAFDNVRIRIMKTFNKNDYRYKIIKKYKRLLSKDKRKIDDRQSRWSYLDNEMKASDFIELVKSFHIDLSNAYDIKEEFFSSYRKTSFDNASTFIDYFINKMNGSLIPEFIEAANTFKNWKPYIVNSFNKDKYGKRMSNGIIEGTNNCIKAIKRISFGYDNFNHFRNRLMYIINKDELPLQLPRSKKQIDESMLLVLHKRGKYNKGFIRTKDKRSNAYKIKHLNYDSTPLMIEKEAILYLKSINVTDIELKLLNDWIKDGNDFYSNPINELDSNNQQIDFISYIRKTRK